MKLSTLDRRIVRLAIPALGTLAIEPMYVLVDTAIVGHLGTEPLAGLAIAATILLTITSFVMFLEYGVTPDVARALGRGDTRSAGVAATDSLWIASLLGAPAAILIAVLARPLTGLFSSHDEVIDAATTYLRISAVGLPFVWMTMAGHGVMRGHNNLTRPLVIVLVANAVNVVLEIVVVYGFDMGVAGSAWSTVVVQIGAAFAFTGIMRPYMARIAPAWRRMRPILARAGHLGLRSMAMLAAWVATTRVASHVGTSTLAAHQVIQQLFTLFGLALDSLAIPAQSLVAGALGGGDTDEAMAVGRSSLKMSVWVAMAFAAVLAGSSPFVGRLFSGDDAVVSRVVVGALVLAALQIPNAIAFALDGVLIGGHDTKYLGRAAVFNLLPFVPALALVIAFPSLGIAGLWAALLVWMTARATVNYRRFISRRWMVSEPVAVASGH